MNGLATAETHGYILVNFTEEVVKKKVRDLMNTYEMCQCEKCFLDACAIVLNSMEPRYVTTTKGMLLSKLDASNAQYRADLAASVLRALKVVKESPKH